MSEAVKVIVDAYVKLNDRHALEDLRDHRQRMRKRLEEKAGGLFDLSRHIRTCDEELEIIESGLARLSACAADKSR
jgi:hypothetical protein